MEEPGVFAALVALVGTLLNFAWTGFAALLDVTRDVGPLKALTGLVVVLLGFYGVAIWMQSRLNRKLSEAPDAHVNLFLHELSFSLPGMAARFILAPFLYVYRLFLGVRTKVRTRVEGPGQPAALNKATEAKEAAPPEPVLVASLGPSFLGASVLMALLYLLGLLTEPLLRYQMDTAPGLSAWEVLLLGGRPEMQWYIPLHRYPWMGGVLTFLCWSFLWWQVARVWRLVHFRDLGRNLIRDLDDVGTLPSWRTYFGATELWRPDPTYLRWAKWLPMVSAPFLVGSWAALGLMPYPMSASMFSISLLLGFGWVIHMSSQGVFVAPQQEVVAPPPPRQVSQANSWAGILDELAHKFQIEPPALFEAPRRIEPLAMSSIDVRQEGVISDLLLELLPQPKQLTFMQYAVLRTLSLLGYVHTEAPLPKGELEIGPAAAAAPEQEGARHRNQIVLAPEGMGKSMLAMLAACNHAILHTRSTLIVLRDEPGAQGFARKVQRALSSTTLRWNIRTRLVGGDLAQDLAQGIIPDIVVCSVRQLVLNILGESQTYRPILENIGLIVLDDVEALCGPVEVHAQLAMRRLLARLKEIASAEDADAPTMPMTLVLGTDTMHDTPAWVRSLCGVDAVSRYFDYSAEEAQAREDALRAYHGLEVEQDKTLLGGEGALQLIYRLGDFKNADDESLSVQDLIEACEQLAVPWHYRPCGDAKRHLGRSLLYLRDEPKYFMASPLDAGVIFLQGHWSEVQREILRLRRAGAHFDPGRHATGPKNALEDPEHPEEEVAGGGRHENTSAPVSIITIVDQDEEMALTEFNQNSSLKAALDLLPRPVVRPPVGETVREHLAAELTSNWIEVKDVLEIFGNSTAMTLNRLAQMSVLMSEERVALSADVQAYDHRVYVRATSRAVGLADHRLSESLLPAKVSQVELLSNQRVALRDRTSLNRLGEADATSAWHTYYMGRIFENAGGRFVVVGRAGDADCDDLVTHDVLIEPYLGDSISSPRRRTWVYHCPEPQAREIHRERGIAPPPDSLEPVLIGDFPVAISLGSVTCLTDHIATYRLGPRTGEIRQRTLLDETDESGQKRPPLSLQTTALGLYPNPASSKPQPALRLEEARLIAAAMRAVLPTMYRGAEDTLELAVHLRDSSPAPDRELGPEEGFFFYEPQPGGTGAARALRRDGVDLLLRLCRVYLERVLYHDRLRAHYDTWGDEEEVMEGQVEDDAPTGGGEDTWFETSTHQAIPATAPAPTRRERDRHVRQAALSWLDSRLRPEGSLSGGRRAGTYGSGAEEGEGDLFDIGRCWYSRGGDVTQLVWAKHRWRLDDQGGEAMLDLAFDRQTVAQARFLGPEHEKLGSLLETMTEAIAQGGSAPEPVFLKARGRQEVERSEGAVLEHPDLLAYQVLANALVLHDYHTLGPLASMLRERSQVDPSSPLGRMALIDYVSRFVQGIPSTAVGAERLVSKPPVYALLHRLADEDSKSVILSVLLAHSGVDAGIFVSLEQGRAIGGIALFDGSQSDAAGRIQQLYTSASRKPPEPVVWAQAMVSSKTAEPRQRIFLPVEVTGTFRPGFVSFESADSWAFIPLSPAWQRVREEREEEKLL